MARDKDLMAAPRPRRPRASKKLPVDHGGHPVTDESGQAWRSAREEEPIDAESLDEETQPSGRQRFQDWQEKLRDRTRGFFGEQTRQKMQDHEQRHRVDADRSERDSEDLGPREQLLKLRSETRLAGEQYMASLRESNLLVPGYNDEERGKDLSVMHHVYMQMMMQSCLKPLSHGVNTNSVIQAVGMMTAMQLLSKDFRQEVGTYFQPIKDKIQDRIDTRTRTMAASAQRGIEGRQHLYAGVKDDRLRERLIGSTDARDHMTRKWRNRLDKLERTERGNRDLYTPESAAMTEVALMENAFWKMRDPETDSNQIHESYRAMRKRLHDQMTDDGLSRQDVVAQARMIIGQRMEHEPELRTMFNGMAHGRLVKAPPHEEQIGDSGKVREVWTGEFDDQTGAHVRRDGMFTLRRPMNANEHQVQLGETMRASLLQSLDKDDMEGFKGNLQGYLVGFAARRQGLDTTGLPDLLRQRLDQSEIMIASMDIDGLSEEEQQRVYSNAYVDALEGVAQEHPDLTTHLQAALGDDWQKALQDAVDDPLAFYHQQRTAPASGPASGAGRSSDDGPSSPHAQADAEDFQPA